MPDRVVLDTSYLITLADPTRAHHQAARAYWRSFLERQISICIPTIVISEFYVKQQIDPGILHACTVAPFNWDDALRAAALHASFLATRPPNESRDGLKDDVKIIAQALVMRARWIITDDERSFYKFAKRAAEQTTPGVDPLQPLALKDGFDVAFFEPGKQRKLFSAQEETSGASPSGPDVDP